MMIPDQGPSDHQIQFDDTAAGVMMLNDGNTAA
jgi:hypothetical protein